MTFALLTAASACSLSGEVDNDGANIDGEVSVPNSVSVPLNGTQGE